MPSEKTVEAPDRKRKLSNKAEPKLDCPLPSAAKRRKVENHQPQRTPSSFWDNLSRLWLTPRALREFDRRTVWPPAPVPPDRPDKKHIHFAQLKRFARRGGPSLGELRAYPEPETAIPLHQIMSTSQSGSKKRARREDESEISVKSRKTSAYDPNFEQHLIDHDIYPEGYGGLENVREPLNLEEIQARLAIPRASLSPSRFGREEFWDFKEKNRGALTESTAMSKAFPIITGNAKIPSQENLIFGNLKDLTDGSISKAQPDFYDGTRPAQENKQLRTDLGPYIVPSTDTTAPCLPNFFAEAKGRNGSPAVCERQALYDGALGARGVHELRLYVDGETLYDNNAYTITSTYHAATGVLNMYTMHPTPSTDPGNVSNFRQTQLGGWSMTANVDAFRQGASALRNARDWAQEKRKELIAAANGKRLNTESPELDSSTHNSLSPSTNEAVDQESDTSTDELALATAPSSSHKNPGGTRKDIPKASSNHR